MMTVGWYRVIEAFVIHELSEEGLSMLMIARRTKEFTEAL